MLTSVFGAVGVIHTGLDWLSALMTGGFGLLGVVAGAFLGDVIRTRAEHRREQQAIRRSAKLLLGAAIDLRLAIPSVIKRIAAVERLQNDLGQL